MALGTSDLYLTIEPVVREEYGMAQEEMKAQYSQIAKVSSTDEPIMEFMELAGPGRLDLKNENEPMIMRTIKQGPVKRVAAATYAAGITISREAVKDTKVEQIKSAARALGRAVKKTPEHLFAQFLDRSFNSAYPVTADGKELFSTSHLTPYGTTFANALAVPAALSEETMEDVKTAVRQTIGPDGMLAQVQVKQWIVPSALGHLMKKLTTSPKTLGSANNDPNVNDGDKYMIFDYLTNSTRYIAQTDADRGFYWMWREAAQFDRDNVATTLQAVFISFFRAMWGAKDPRCGYAVNAS
jgi:hypothetical protein